MIESAIMTSRKRDIDGGWAWVVLAAVYSGILLLSTAMYTAGVLYVEMLDYYRDDAAKTSIIGSLNSGLLGLLGPLVSICIHTLSCRVTMFTGGVCLMLAYVSSAFVSNINLLILSIGIVGGLGNALTGVTFTVVLVYYFERRRNIVLTLSQAVIGVAMFLATPIALWLLRAYGLRGTFLMIAGICAHLCVCAMICQPSVKEAKVKTELLKRKERPSVKPYQYCNWYALLDFQVLRSLPFILFLISTAAWNFMLSVCLIHLPNYVITKGLDSTDVTVMMTIFSISNTIGRFSAVFIVDHQYLDNMVVHICCLATAGIITLTFALYDHLPSAEFVFVAAIGILTGLPNSLLTPLTLTLVDVEKISIAHGLVNFFCGIGYVSGPPLAALLLERTGSYENSIMMSGAVLLFGSVMAVAAKIRQRKEQEERKKTKAESGGDEFQTFLEKIQH
ncbi:monocarboxylate transporter 12-like isoform X1 [Mya arenaria]|uniref:monocarboxylate transporter 12-like isoform X1 n=2 Tax=Mya arenaria TaxID=6604 RepID=UPI0022E1C7B0|nr:monocarboxylate transporter 12-like isoform X1 [Mya arenaria]